MAKRLTGFFHEEDPTRPTTSAFNNPEGAIKNELADERGSVRASTTGPAYTSRS